MYATAVAARDGPLTTPLVNVGDLAESLGATAAATYATAVASGNQGLPFRRNFGENFVSASSREVKFRYFSPFFVLKFKNSKIFIKNLEKYDKN